MPAISSGNATLSITVRQGKVDSSWKIMPIDGCGPRTVSPPTLTRPLIAVEQAADDVEQRGLAAAGRADHRQEFARHDVERHMVDRDEHAVLRLELLEDVIDDEERLASGAIPDGEASVTAHRPVNAIRCRDRPCRAPSPRPWPGCSRRGCARRPPRRRRPRPRRSPP